MKRQCNRVLIAIDAYIKGHRKSIDNNKKMVLIVFQQIFGDSIMIQNSLMEYSKLFPKSKGYKVMFLARPSVITFMQSTLPLPTEIKLEGVDFKLFLEDFAYYRSIVAKYRGMADLIIVPGTSLSAEIFSAASGARRKVGLVRSFNVTQPAIMAIFAKLAYTEQVRPPKEEMMIQRHRRLLNYLGDREYKGKLPVLLPKDRVIHEEHYCVMCPGASKMEKCWPGERFSLVADYIIEKYGMNVHLCGGAEELMYEKLILSKSKYPEHIVSHIGKTGFSQWSAIVQYADLVIGNDSATMHLAAAGRRKAICIAGVYDKYQFFPYKVDELDEEDRLPVTLLKDMPCAWCRTIGYEAGYGNAECKKRIDEKLCAGCIDMITVQDVERQIDSLLS